MNTLAKLWYWLTHHTDCGWCNKRLHRAWLPTRDLFKVTTGMCRECHANEQAVIIRMVEAKANGAN